MSAGTVLRARALLLDMDGTLVDSTAVVEAIWTEYALEHGHDPAAILASSHGRPTRSIVDDFPPSAGDVDDVVTALESHELEDGGGVVEVPGARTFVDALPRDRVALVTSAPLPLATRRMAAAGVRMPDVVVTPTDVTAGKPAPDPYLLGARRLGLEASQCLALEDAPAGIASARAAGAAVLVVGAHAADGLPSVPDLSRVRVEVDGDDLVVRL